MFRKPIKRGVVIAIAVIALLAISAGAYFAFRNINGFQTYAPNDALLVTWVQASTTCSTSDPLGRASVTCWQSNGALGFRPNIRTANAAQGVVTTLNATLSHDGVLGTALPACVGSPDLSTLPTWITVTVDGPTAPLQPGSTAPIVAVITYGPDTPIGDGIAELDPFTMPFEIVEVPMAAVACP